MDEICPNRKKIARNFWGRTSTARIRPVRPKKYPLCSDSKISSATEEFILPEQVNNLLQKIRFLGASRSQLTAKEDIKHPFLQ
jgi:hypothetical protein